jgi:hypothetical protein
MAKFVLWWLVALRGPRRDEVSGLRWLDVDLAATLALAAC